jgi:hypothetical protein
MKKNTYSPFCSDGNIAWHSNEKNTGARLVRRPWESHSLIHPDSYRSCQK